MSLNVDFVAVTNFFKIKDQNKKNKKIGSNLIDNLQVISLHIFTWCALYNKILKLALFAACMVDKWVEHGRSVVRIPGRVKSKTEQ